MLSDRARVAGPKRGMRPVRQKKRARPDATAQRGSRNSTLGVRREAGSRRIGVVHACVYAERNGGEARPMLRPASRNREACRYSAWPIIRASRPITYWFFTYDLIHYHSVIYICPACCEFRGFRGFCDKGVGASRARGDA